MTQIFKGWNATLWKARSHVSMSWLLMALWHKEPGHQQSWYWLTPHGWFRCQHLGLVLLTLSRHKNWDSHSLVNGYPSFYPRIALAAPSPEGLLFNDISIVSHILYRHWPFSGPFHHFHHLALGWAISSYCATCKVLMLVTKYCHWKWLTRFVLYTMFRFWWPNIVTENNKQDFCYVQSFNFGEQILSLKMTNEICAIKICAINKASILGDQIFSLKITNEICAIYKLSILTIKYCYWKWLITFCKASQHSRCYFFHRKTEYIDLNK